MSRTCSLTGKSVMSGNNRSHAENKTKRVFRPNLVRASLWSETLGERVRLPDAGTRQPAGRPGTEAQAPRREGCSAPERHRLTLPS